MTPLIFAAQSLTAVHEHSAPVWWQNLDFLFIVISFIAIYQSSKNSNNISIKYIHKINNIKTLYLKNSYFITLKNSVGVSFLYLTYSSSCPHFLSLIVSNILTPLT